MWATGITCFSVCKRYHKIMSHIAYITKPRVSAGGFYVVKDAFNKLKPGPVKIILGPSSTIVLEGKVKRLDIRAQGYCTCRDLYRKSAGTIKAPLPLRLEDVLEYEIENGNVRLLAIHRIGENSPSPASVSPRPVNPALTNADLCNVLACQFIEKLKNRKSARVDLSNENDWFEGAFTASAGAGNPKGAVLGLDSKAKHGIETIVANFLGALAKEGFCGQSRFEWLFARAVHQIENAVFTHSPGTSFSFGRAQKILNILAKYCYVWWLCKRSESSKLGDLSWVDKWRPYLHVPVDRETMKYLSKHKCYRDLVHELGKSALVSWKWKMDEYSYLGIQDAVRKLAYGAKLDPICYEMKYIWPV
jgi:hypothetical protein